MKIMLGYEVTDANDKRTRATDAVDTKGSGISECRRFFDKSLFIRNKSRY
jgi:hypothetical protein